MYAVLVILLLNNVYLLIYVCDDCNVSNVVSLAREVKKGFRHFLSETSDPVYVPEFWNRPISRTSAPRRFLHKLKYTGPGNQLYELNVTEALGVQSLDPTSSDVFLGSVYIGTFETFFKKQLELQLVSDFKDGLTFNELHYSSADLSDPLALLALVSSRFVHGTADSRASFHRLIAELHHRQLSLTCGEVSVFVDAILRRLGIKSRILTTLTLDEWNSYDNGHTMIEVYIEERRRWVAIDLDQKVVFKSSEHDEYLNGFDLATMNLDDLRIVSLVNADVIDYSGMVAYQSYLQFLRVNQVQWYQRVMQSIGIYDQRSSRYVFVTSDDNPSSSFRISQYAPDYSVVEIPKFKEIFY